MIRRLIDLIPKGGLLGAKAAPKPAKVSGSPGAPGREGAPGVPLTPGLSRKWLPVIDTDMCGGCGECVRACEPDCIDMVWSFATLVRPEACTSCGDCMEACVHDVIEMGWVELTVGDRTGRWFEEGKVEVGVVDVKRAVGPSKP